jgi:GST-like protein
LAGSDFSTNSQDEVLTTDKRPRDRYVNESRRLLKVLDQRLEGRAWIMGDAYTVVDICTFP